MALNSERLATLRELLGADFPELARRFQCDGNRQMEAAVSALEDEAWQVLRQCAHGVRGAASNIGADALGQLCAALEAQALAAQRSACAALLVEVHSELERVCRALREAVDGRS
jgi:HPt (histidine-containing phosphotransfer) domain-containing protein